MYFIFHCIPFFILRQYSYMVSIYIKLYEITKKWSLMLLVKASNPWVSNAYMLFSWWNGFTLMFNDQRFWLLRYVKLWIPFQMVRIKPTTRPLWIKYTRVKSHKICTKLRHAAQISYFRKNYPGFLQNESRNQIHFKQFNLYPWKQSIVLLW